MPSSTLPQRTAGYSTWSCGNETCAVTFVGKGPVTDRSTAFAEVVGKSGMDLAWPHQIHSPVVLAADRGGLLGQGDALWTSEAGSLHAWIGPAIGQCCYEVGPDVARKVVAASSAAVCSHRHRRPHLDLTGAVVHQLTAGGVEDIHALEICTRCCPQWLWSYRRDGAAAGRNWAFAWKR